MFPFFPCDGEIRKIFPLFADSLSIFSKNFHLVFCTFTSFLNNSFVCSVCNCRSSSVFIYLLHCGNMHMHGKIENITFYASSLFLLELLSHSFISIALHYIASFFMDLYLYLSLFHPKCYVMNL